MKSGKLSSTILPVLAVVAVGAAVFYFWPRSNVVLDRPFEPAEIQTVDPASGCRIFMAGDRISTEPGQFPSTKGFVEGVVLEETILTIRGWAPMDVRSPEGRLIIRDPFGLLEPVGQATFTLQERPDVEKGHPDEPALLHSGFSLATPVSHPVDTREWLNSLEFYAVDAVGNLFRLSRIHQVRQAGWSKQPDTFELSIVYSNPPYSQTETKTGNLDAIVPADDQGTMELQGWAFMDMHAPGARLCLRLPARVAPASILDCTIVERRDVVRAYPKEQTNLRYSGFKILVATRGLGDALLKKGALQMWSIDGDNNISAIHSPNH